MGEAGAATPWARELQAALRPLLQAFGYSLKDSNRAQVPCGAMCRQHRVAIWNLCESRRLGGLEFGGQLASGAISQLCGGLAKAATSVPLDSCRALLTGPEF